MYPPPDKTLPILEKLRQAYLIWFQYYTKLPKTHRYSLGLRIDHIFIEVIEAISSAVFLAREEKLPYVRLAIRKIDTIKILLLVLWETKSLENKRYLALSEKVQEIGRMLGGWNGQLAKQNSQEKILGEKRRE